MLAWTSHHPSCTFSVACLLTLATAACSGATRSGAPRPKTGTAALTSANAAAPRIERVLVADTGFVAMVARDGCLAVVTATGANAAAAAAPATDRDVPIDDLRVRCPRPERLSAWFADFDRTTAGIALERAPDDEEDLKLPAAEMVTAAGAVMKASHGADVTRLIAEVRKLSAELASAEMPAPGPASPSGWQMLRVGGPAHVVFAGTAADGTLDARLSTTGQYLCDFVADTEEGPLHATKSGWLAPVAAARAIDAVLQPFQAGASAERGLRTFASATQQGAERRADTPSTAAVFERFASLQDELGDACVPELEPPTPVGP